MVQLCLRWDSIILGFYSNLVQNFLGKQLNGQNGPDVKATIVQYSQVKPSDIKVIGMEDIHKAKYSTYFSMDQVDFQIDASNSNFIWPHRALMTLVECIHLKIFIRHGSISSPKLNPS